MATKKIVVLGGGMVGSVIAADLGEDPDLEVSLVDLRGDALLPIPGVEIVTEDLSKPTCVRDIAKLHDVVVGALPSSLGLQTMEAVIAAQRPYCDISFMAENPLDLDAQAKAAGATVVFDCGVSPGSSNLLIGYAVSRLDRTESVTIYVGGLPRERRWPYQYKAAFAPFDVIEEYVRPSRIVAGGEVILREALSEPELIDFPGVGTLEAFNTDGLRSLLHTLDAPYRIEKTLRYPGHIELMRVFRHMGLFSEKPVPVGREGQQVVPRELLAALLFPQWTYEDLEEDLTALRVIVEGEKDGLPLTHRFELFDVYDTATGRTSMARTTGYPAAIVARALADGTLQQPGVQALEAFGADANFVEHFLAELARRGVCFERFEE